MKKTFIVTEAVTAYRELYISAETEAEARKMWAYGEFDDSGDFDLSDDYEFVDIVEVTEQQN